MLNRDSKNEVWSRCVWNLWYELNPRVRCAFGNVWTSPGPFTKSYPSYIYLVDFFLQTSYHIVFILEVIDMYSPAMEEATKKKVKTIYNETNNGSLTEVWIHQFVLLPVQVDYSSCSCYHCTSLHFLPED